MTKIFYKYAHLPTLSLSISLFFSHFLLTGPTHSLQCDFQRENYHSLISTNSSIPPQKCMSHATIFLLDTPFRWEFFSASKTTEISSNHRKKQTNNMGEDTFLLIYTIKIL